MVVDFRVSVVRTLALLVVLVCMLSACVPASEGPTVEIAQLTEATSYYPQEVGATWQYLPSGAALNDPKYTRRIEGPTVIDGEIWVATRSTGLGLETTNFRQYRRDGVHLLRSVRPGVQFTFNPPIRQFPEKDSMRVGSTWSGKTTVSMFFSNAKPENQRSQLEFEYVYTVVDRRPVTLQAGDFEVFVINFVTRTLDEEGEVTDSLTRETWFTPFVGEVRTEEGFFLIDTNVVN